MPKDGQNVRGAVHYLQAQPNESLPARELGSEAAHVRSFLDHLDDLGNEGVITAAFPGPGGEKSCTKREGLRRFRGTGLALVLSSLGRS